MADEQKVVEVPEKFKALVEQIEKLSVLDLSELVKVLEEKFGVSAAAPMTIAPINAAQFHLKFQRMVAAPASNVAIEAIRPIQPGSNPLETEYQDPKRLKATSPK